MRILFILAEILNKFVQDFALRGLKRSGRLRCAVITVDRNEKLMKTLQVEEDSVKFVSSSQKRTGRSGSSR